MSYFIYLEFVIAYIANAIYLVMYASCHVYTAITIKGIVQHTGGKNPMKKAKVDASAIMFYLPGKKAPPLWRGAMPSALIVPVGRRLSTVGNLCADFLDNPLAELETADHNETTEQQRNDSTGERVERALSGSTDSRDSRGRIAVGSHVAFGSERRNSAKKCGNCESNLLHEFTSML